MKQTVESPTNQPLEAGFELGKVRIDPRSGAASGPGGTEKLDPKVMAVLFRLAAGAGQVVTREDLISTIWPDVVVGDEVLSRCIYELRRQLVKAAGEDGFKDAIETLPKRGYRLRIPVAATSHAVLQQPRRRPGLLVAAGVIAVALVILWKLQPTKEPADASAGMNSIAVLPFIDMSPGKDQAFLADGFAEEILNKLAQSKDLRVIARTSSFAVRNAALDVADIARRLDVSHVLEGSVRKSGDTVRITAQLIAASDSSHVWSESYDRDVTDLLAVQTEIADAVATALAATLAPNPSAAGPRPSEEAYEKFLQGEFFYYRRGAGDISRALGYYEEAVALEPGFARAWAALSGAYSLMADPSAGAGSSTAPGNILYREKQREAALKAVSLEPDLAVAHARLSRYYYLVGEVDKGEQHRDMARKLDPNDPFVLAHDVEHAVDRDDLDTAINIQRGIAARDPLSGVIRQNLAVLLLADGRFEDALAEFRKVQDIRPQDDSEISNEIAHALILLRRFEEALAESAKVQAGEPRDQVMALLKAATGHMQEADDALTRLLDSEDHIFDTVRIAEIYAYRGMADEAFAALQRRSQALVREHGTQSDYGWYLRYEARLSPFLKTLHGDSRWADFMAGAG